MKKKALLLLVALVIVIASISGLVACVGDNAGDDLAEKPDAKYTVTFMADGETVGTATYSEKNKDITEPEVPKKDGYTGAWEEYKLITGDISVNALYSTEGATKGLIYLLNDKEYTITNYKGSETNVIIPNFFSNFPVTSIGQSAFKDCSSLTSIIIPSSVTRIGEDAFKRCNSGIQYVDKWVVGYYRTETSVVLKENTVGIVDYAFYGCSSMESIEIPASVAIIGYRAFSECSSMVSIEIPKGVTSIGDQAFSGCSRLENIGIPEGVTSIGDQAFSGCSRLENIGIPEGVTSIGSRAFSGCSSIESIEIPNSVTSIGSYAFYECSSLASIEIPEGVILQIHYIMQRTYI